MGLGTRSIRARVVYAILIDVLSNRDVLLYPTAPLLLFLPQYIPLSPREACMTFTSCSHGVWGAGEFGDELFSQLVFKVVLELFCLMHGR